jgi:hypothetical protein
MAAQVRFDQMIGDDRRLGIVASGRFHDRTRDLAQPGMIDDD